MKKLFNAAFVYLFIGLAFGVFYREFTKLNDFPEGQSTQLSVVHTHLLALGFLFLLIVLLLEKTFELSRSPKLFSWFFWLYNIGLTLTVGLLVWRGTLTVLGKESSAMISGIAGLGHMFLTAGFIVFFVALRRAIATPTGSKTTEALMP